MGRRKGKMDFRIVDVVGILTDSPNPRNYWKVLKHRLLKEGNESITNCNQLKLQSSDGKFYKTDVADTEQLLRLIQSIPSPKAEPFKQWLAKVGYERMQEIADPSQSIERARENWQKLGRLYLSHRDSLNLAVGFNPRDRFHIFRRVVTAEKHYAEFVQLSQRDKNTIYAFRGLKSTAKFNISLRDFKPAKLK
jgi:BRO family, N-terminal domain